MISAELPDSKTNKLAHETVARCMMYGPCGVAFSNAPCMEEGKCKKQYPRKFQSETTSDVNRYPIYWCRDTGHTILVHGIELDYCWVVPHNVYLLTKYDAHINVEVCNNIRAINIYSSTYIKDMIVQLLRSHVRATMPSKGMWLNLMKLKNISIVVMYLHWRQRGASSSLICMSGFLPLNVCNTICPINKYCCFMMTMMCTKWQHGQPFPDGVHRMVQNKPRIRSWTKPYIRSIPLTMGVESEVEAMDNAQECFCH
jgi:hypothetical protein